MTSRQRPLAPVLWVHHYPSNGKYRNRASCQTKAPLVTAALASTMRLPVPDPFYSQPPFVTLRLTGIVWAGSSPAWPAFTEGRFFRAGDLSRSTLGSGQRVRGDEAEGHETIFKGTASADSLRGMLHADRNKVCDGSGRVC